MKSETKGRNHHPTKEKLIEVTVEMLGSQFDEVSTEMILEASGVSSGSVYHHFEDIDDLIETAYVRRFSRFVDLSIGMIRGELAKASSREEMIDTMKAVTRATQPRDLAPIRFERARIVAMAERNERFRAKLEVEQDRLTDALAEIFAGLQANGWLRPEFDPRVGAVMIQAYTLGKVVDDVSSRPMDEVAWHALIDDLLVLIFARP